MTSDILNNPPHVPVLENEVIESLLIQDGGIYVDGTLGAGGHSLSILNHSGPSGRLIAFDKDLSAHELAQNRLSAFSKRTSFIHSSFAELSTQLEGMGISQVSGILLDLGVSSMQLDRRERGFSFMQDGPLDMRMDSSKGQTALELIRNTDPNSLANIIYEYGDERFSRRIAPKIHEAAVQNELSSTLELAHIVSACIPNKAKHRMRIHPATKTFQALRIAVNKELDDLKSFLNSFVEKLEIGGRCAIISFHSLEDRLVKNAFRDLEKTSSLPYQMALDAGERPFALCKRITKKPLVASAAEIAQNPRSRSAKLRVCEKLPR